MKFCLEWKLYSQLTFMWAIPCRLVNCEVQRTLNNNESPFINERLIMNFDSINLLLLIFRWLYALICWNSQNGLTLRPLWISPSLTCTILHILRRPNSIIALLLIQNTFPFLKEFHSWFFCSPTITQSYPQVFSVNGSIICSRLHFGCHLDIIGSIICRGLHFWRHWFNMMKILSKFGEQQLVMVNYACGLKRLFVHLNPRFLPTSCADHYLSKWVILQRM